MNRVIIPFDGVSADANVVLARFRYFFGGDPIIGANARNDRFEPVYILSRAILCRSMIHGIGDLIEELNGRVEEEFMVCFRKFRRWGE